MKERFYYCKSCGAIMGLIHGEHPAASCLDGFEPMEVKNEESGREKHLPKVEVQDSKVRVEVGEISHPMEEGHHIAWVYLRTDRGGQRKTLLPNQSPMVEFALLDEKPLAVYAYCNQHGLWKRSL